MAKSSWRVSCRSFCYTPASGSHTRAPPHPDAPTRAPANFTEDMMDKLYVSTEGLERMKAELVELNERRMKVAGAIEHARSLGDLKENAEYHSAKEEQSMLHARINDLEDKLTRCELLENQDIDTSKVYLGATVSVVNLKTKKQVTYMIVSTVEADMALGRISAQSPVGKALLGKKVGEKAVAHVPAGDLELQIKEIKY
jgi:transcription elongation factor GreA